MASGIFDPYYAAEVLSELLSRQRGCDVELIVTPKAPGKEAQADSTGG